MDPSTVTTVGSRSDGHVRIIAPLTFGYIRFIDSGVEGKIHPPAADWLLHNPEANQAEFDTRLRASTDSGEVYIHYRGRIGLDDAAKKFLTFSPEASTTEFGDAYWVMTPSLETSDERLKTFEDVQLLGQGRWIVDNNGKGVEYEVFAVKVGGLTKP